MRMDSYVKRDEQKRRWAESETNKQPLNRAKRSRVKFHSSLVFFSVCQTGDLKELEELLDSGVDINARDENGLTALHEACIDDNIEMVDFLLKHGADINAADPEGWTPLHAAASCGFSDIITRLIEEGADLECVTLDGDLPVDITDPEKEQVNKILEDAYAARGINTSEARRAEEVALERDVEKWKASGVPLLVDAITGATPLHVAAAKCYLNALRILLTGDAPVNAVDLEGWTPLMAAAHWDHEEAVQLLTRHGADYSIKNLLDQTVLDVAHENLTSLVQRNFNVWSQNHQNEIDSRITEAAEEPKVPALPSESFPEVPESSVDSDEAPPPSVPVLPPPRTTKPRAPALPPASCNTRVLTPGPKPKSEPKMPLLNRRVLPSTSSSGGSQLLSTTTKTTAGATVGEPSRLCIPAVFYPSKTPAISLRPSSLSSARLNSGTIDFLTKDDRSSSSGDDSATRKVPPTAVVPPSGRSALLPQTNEAADVERRSRAKQRVSSRRSTQGVTLDEIQQAKQLSAPSTTPLDAASSSVPVPPPPSRLTQAADLPARSTPLAAVAEVPSRPAPLATVPEVPSEAPSLPDVDFVDDTPSPAERGLSSRNSLVADLKQLAVEDGIPATATAPPSAASAFGTSHIPFIRSASQPNGSRSRGAIATVTPMTQPQTKAADSSSRSFRHWNSLDEPSVPSPALRNSSAIRTVSEPTNTTATTTNWQQMFETERAENARLLQENRQFTAEVRTLRNDLDTLRQTREIDGKKQPLSRGGEVSSRGRTKCYPANYLACHENGGDQESRRLERRVSELEEEVRELDRFRHEASKLKDENAALIRVISKLSKE